MGFGGISIWQLLIIFAIILLIFGGKRLRNLGGDVGTAIKGFKNAMQDTKPDEDEQVDKKENQLDQPHHSELDDEKINQETSVKSSHKSSHE